MNSYKISGTRYSMLLLSDLGNFATICILICYIKGVKNYIKFPDHFK